MKITIAGENALIIYTEDSAHNSLAKHNEALFALEQAIKSTMFNCLIDTVLSYRSLLVIFDYTKINHFKARKEIKSLLQNSNAHRNTHNKKIELPCWYDMEVGCDIERICNNKGISIETLITLHSGTVYRIYAIGFAPGFAYLGEVDSKIAIPRLDRPRPHIPKGSVGIADRQTAVYPHDSPGGWNIIGRCPIQLFNADHTPPMTFSTGDRVSFNPISKNEFLALGGEI